MVHDTVKHLFRILGTLALLGLLASATLIWRLGQGPLSLSPLTPWLEDALNDSDPPFRITLKDSLLSWRGRGHPVELDVVGVEATDRNGQVIARVPELAITLAPWPLLNGTLHLRTLEIVSPHLTLVRSSDGNWLAGLEEGNAPSPPPSLADPAATPPEATPPAATPPAATPPAALPPEQGATARPLLGVLLEALSGDTGGPLAELSAIRIRTGTATLYDRQLGVTWQVPRLDLGLSRDRPHRKDGASSSPQVLVEAALEVNEEHLGGKALALALKGTVDPKQAEARLKLEVSGLRPADLAPLAPALAPLAAADLPLSGSVEATVGLSATPRLQNAALHLKSGAGSLHLPAPLETTFRLDGLSLEARATARNGGDLASPEDIATLSLDGLELTLSPLAAGDPPSVVRLSGSLERLADGTRSGSLHAETRNVPVNSLSSWWPPSVAPNPREWVTGHLKNGLADHGEWTVGLKGTTLELLEPVSLEGTLHASGVGVDYLPPMPAASGAEANVRFALDRLDISLLDGHIDQGKGGLLSVQKGDIALTGLDAETQYTDIRLTIGGPVSDALRLLDSKPLGYASKLGVNPGKASGQAVTDLHMNFPTLANLKLEQIQVEASATVSNASLGGAVFGQDLTGGNLTLTVSTSRLEARGQASVGGIPATFTWWEVFSGKPWRSRYQVHATVEEDKRQIFGLTFPPFTPTFIKGPVQANLDLTISNNGLTVINTEADLSASEMYIPGYNWSKAAGRPAQATATVRLVNGKVREVPSLSVKADGGKGQGMLAASGSVSLDRDSGLQEISLPRVELGNSQFAVTLKKQPRGDGFAVDLRGSALDLVPFRHRTKEENARLATLPAAQLARCRQGSNDPACGSREELPPLSITAHLDTVWLDDNGVLDAVQARASRANGRWLEADLRATTEGSFAVRYQLEPVPGAGDPLIRRFSASTDNAGGLLRSAGILETMQGGTLASSGTVDRAGKARGTLTISDYRLVQAPLLARLLSVAALTGILDALTGDGIAFDTLQSSFTLDDDALVVPDFRTHGSSLGLTGKGRINMVRDSFDIAGTIVPAYLFNSLLGKIPLVGGLLTGFTDGGGLIAATYTLQGPTEEPDITVNPLSAFAPGFLKLLFGAGAPEEPVQPEADSP